MDQQANLHRLNLLGSRPKSFLSTILGIRYESWVYPRKTESILYYYAQALQPLTFLEKQLGSPVNCREFYDFWSPSAILASAIRTISCQGMARQRVCGGFPRPRGAIGVFHKAFASYFNSRCSQRPPIAMSKALHAVGAAVLMDRAPPGKLPCHSVQKKSTFGNSFTDPKFLVYSLQYICSIAAQDNLYER